MHIFTYRWESVSHEFREDRGINALYVLMDFGDKSVQGQIKKALADPQWYVRQNACIACSRFGFRTARTQLKKMSLTDDRKAVRQAALAALEELEGI